MPMYNITEHSDNYLKKSCSLWQYCKDIPAVNNNGDVVDFKPQSVHYFLNFLKKGSQFCCPGVLRNSKLVHLDGKNLTCFIQNLVQNLMNLVLRSESGRKWLKNG